MKKLYNDTPFMNKKKAENLDSLTTKVSNVESSLAQSMTEITNAKGTYPTLEDKLNALVIEGGGTPSNVILFENWTGGESVTIDTNTTPTPDVTPPNNVTGVGASNVTQTSMTISWGSVSDAISYEVWRNGSLLTTVSTINYNASGLTANTSYSWVIKAKDSAGNTASGSTPFVQNTLAVNEEPPADTTAPVLTITPAATFTDTQTVTMSTNETATIWYTLDDSDPVTSGTRLQYTASLTLTETDTIKAYAVDSANNASAVQTVTYTKQASATWVTSGLVQKWDNRTSQTSVTNDGTYFPTSGDFTIVATMKPKAFLNILSQFNASSAATSTVRMFLDSTGQKLNVAVYGSTTANPAITGDSELTDTTLYYHVVLVRSGNVFSTYINNVLDKTYNYNSSTLNANNTEPVKIADASSDFKTAVYYSRALTTEELTQNYNALK
jgi:hypothetical protein